MRAKIKGLFIGRPAPFKRDQFISGYKKNNVDLLQIKDSELMGDAAFNLKYHGGADRVVHHFPSENYQLLKDKFPHIADLFLPGSYAENICSVGMTEEQICVGDIIRIGEVLLEVSEPRNPCGVIDLNFGHSGVMQFLLSGGRCGWFYRVLQDGIIKTTDTIELVKRRYPKLSIKDILLKVKVEKGADGDFMRELMGIAELSARYRQGLNK